MSTITTIQGTDVISTSRAVINTNFSNLNTDKIETSYLDTDTALAANSDTKIPSQKAVKTYIDTSGGANASETVRGIVEEATDAEVAAGTATGGTGAKLFVTPAKLIASRHSSTKSVTAGATIAGATLPVPVYQKDTDNEFYACDGNDTAAMKFLGFAISNGTDGAAMTVQFTGVVSGFSALDEGEKYYLSDTVGTIQNTIGTNEVLVGVAISTTELLIQKGRRQARGTVASGDATGSSAITTGFRISKLRLTVREANSGWVSGLDAVWANGSLAGVNFLYNEASSGSDGTGLVCYQESASNRMTYDITSITDTGFTISWTETGTVDGQTILWEAEGEI